MIAHHPQHRFAVFGKAREGAEFGRHFRRGRIGDAGHDRGQRSADGAAGLGVIGNARRHQEAADIGVAEAQRAEVVRALRDFLRRELRHQHRDFQHDGPQPHRVLVAFDVVKLALELFAVGDAGKRSGVELQEVQRSEIARRVVEEHVFRARIRGDDRPRRGASVPVVNGGVELQAGIGAGPGGVADLLPQIARLHGLGDLALLGAPEQIPVAIGLDRFEEFVGDAHRVVGILPGDREIGFRIPIGVVGREVDVGIALVGELDDAADVIVRHVIAPRRLDLAAQHRILLRREAIVARALAIHASLEDRTQMPLIDLGAGDEIGDLLLLEHLPVDELLDIGMIDVEDHHFRRAARGAARLDGARGAVADLQEAHQA